MYVEREKPPEVFDKAGVIAVAATYAGIIGLAWCVRVFAHETKEEIIPIDMTIVMNENLDGEENEPPPEAPPQPAPGPQPVPPARLAHGRGRQTAQGGEGAEAAALNPQEPPDGGPSVI